MASGTGSPCGACKFLRRKCASDCIFAPYFCSEQGQARFAAIHKVFGASNVSKLLLHVPVHDRCEAVVTIAYEAQARLRDPVYGCVAHIFALQQQVASLQAQLMQVKAQLTHALAENHRSVAVENPWHGNIVVPTVVPTMICTHSMSPQSSLDCIDHQNSDQQHEMYCKKRRATHTDLGELQALALRMMRE
ncbi:LOB domain-containing protein 16 [Acorus gramineus]|uniref:LOB domain-containing protein 16 n=1 Tax=Acorus gramineus TaxID=55184 RepID=A0AAV9AQX6_ACOGR|nr:LOB domain-containing protein 16 [Acorus gramineus]